MRYFLLALLPLVLVGCKKQPVIKENSIVKFVRNEVIDGVPWFFIDQVRVGDEGFYLSLPPGCTIYYIAVGGVKFEWDGSSKQEAMKR